MLSLEGFRVRFARGLAPSPTRIYAWASTESNQDLRVGYFLPLTPELESDLCMGFAQHCVWKPGLRVLKAETWVTWGSESRVSSDLSGAEWRLGSNRSSKFFFPNVWALPMFLFWGKSPPYYQQMPWLLRKQRDTMSALFVSISGSLLAECTVLLKGQMRQCYRRICSMLAPQ